MRIKNRILARVEGKRKRAVLLVAAGVRFEDDD
jgi:hypothetical protein